MNSGPVAQLRPMASGPDVLDGGDEGLGGLAAEHGAVELDGAGDDHRPGDSGFAAHRLDGDERRLGVAGVLAGFDGEEIDPALEQAQRLFGEARRPARRR